MIIFIFVIVVVDVVVELLCFCFINFIFDEYCCDVVDFSWVFFWWKYIEQ